MAIRISPAKRPTDTRNLTSAPPKAPSPNGNDAASISPGTAIAPRIAVHAGDRDTSESPPQTRAAAPSTINGKVMTSGISLWSRSVAIARAPAAKHTPKRSRCPGSSKRSGTAARATAAKIATTGVRQSTFRTAPSSWAGQRAAMRSAANPQMSPARPSAGASGSSPAGSDGILAFPSYR